MNIKSIKNAKNLENKIILLRADFNIPIHNNKIEDDFKIIDSLATIDFLLNNKAKVVVLTHLGRPGGKRDAKYSTKPIASRLSELLNKKVNFVDACVGSKVKKAIQSLASNEVLLLENLRFHKEEKVNDLKFAEKLAQLGDIYVNNAFAVSHREHASVNAIKKFLPNYVGFLLENELKNLDKIVIPKKPLVVVLGGAKIFTKLPLIKKFDQNENKILIGGALANNFFLANNLEVGKSLIDEESLEIAKEILSKKSKNILLPIDLVVQTKNSIKLKKIDEVKKNEKIMDIGPETIRLYSDFIKKANTIIWNGPMGFFEEKHFQIGTISIARIVASRSQGQAFGVVGGGETVEALKMTKMFDYVDWVSSGGGAMLSYLGGEKMPGL